MFRNGQNDTAPSIKIITRKPHFIIIYYRRGARDRDVHGTSGDSSHIPVLELDYSYYFKRKETSFASLLSASQQSLHSPYSH